MNCTMQKMSCNNIRNTKMPAMPPDVPFLRSRLCNYILHEEEQGTSNFGVSYNSLEVSVF